MTQHCNMLLPLLTLQLLCWCNWLALPVGMQERLEHLQLWLSGLCWSAMWMGLGPAKPYAWVPLKARAEQQIL